MNTAMSENVNLLSRQAFAPDAALAFLNQWIAKMNSLNLTFWRQTPNQTFQFQLMASKALSDSFLIGTTLNGSIFLGVDNEIGWMLDVPWRRVFVWQDDEMTYLALTAYIDFTPFALILQSNPRLVYQAQTKKFEIMCVTELKEGITGLAQSGSVALPLMLKNLFNEKDA